VFEDFWAVLAGLAWNESKRADRQTLQKMWRVATLTADRPSTNRLVPADPKLRRLYWALWIGVLVSIAVWLAVDTWGWDVAVYGSAIHSLRMHHDPYADATAVQDACHATHCVQGNADPPFSYVYSPITLPVLRVLAVLPLRLDALLYWMAYGAAVVAQLWVCLKAAEDDERLWFLFLAPVAVFFPGLLANGILLGGNVAYLLYAAILLGVYRGLKSGSWAWFYVATLVASCVKAPLLSVVVIPLFVARRQWVPVVATAFSGLTLFALQPLVWPELFRHYLHAVDLQFQYNRDFGCSPAGLMSELLYRHGRSYSPEGLVVYAMYALPVLGALLYTARFYFAGQMSQRQWVPVVLVGVILLNPRIMEYDVAPVTLLMAMIVWRFLRAVLERRAAGAVAVSGFAVLNAFAIHSWEIRKIIDGPLLVLCFAAGLWTLRQEVPEEGRALAKGQDAPWRTYAEPVNSRQR
jgi:hypothetical protein